MRKGIAEYYEYWKVGDFELTMANNNLAIFPDGEEITIETLENYQRGLWKGMKDAYERLPWYKKAWRDITDPGHPFQS